ncbi:hypothetical protein, partial [Gordonia bronchialis]|uniref:hypothetical protein n=1 Tax=Gordonia bronchialis TaxID=2054 RepID=UPI00242DBA03
SAGTFVTAHGQFFMAADNRPCRPRDPKVREELTRVSELLCATNRIGSVRWRLGRYALACQYTQLQRDMP